MSLLTLVRDASAQDSSHTVAIWLEGNFADKLSVGLRRFLGEDVTIVDRNTYQTALKEKQHYGEMGGRLWMPPSKLRSDMFARIGAANTTLDVDYAIIVRARNDADGTWEAYIVLMRGAEILEERGMPFQATAPENVDFASVLGPYFESEDDETPTTPPPVDDDEGDDTPDAGSETSPSQDAAGDEDEDELDAGNEPAGPAPDAPVFVAAVVFSVEGRGVEFAEPVSRNLRPYSALGVPALAAMFELYPLRGTDSALGGLGLEAYGRRTSTFPSATEEGDPIDTAVTEIRGGLRFGLPVHELIELGVSAGAGYASASFGEAGRLDEELPEVAYVFVRPGLDGRLRLEPLRFFLAVGYRLPLSQGPVGDRFESATVHGFDATGGVDVAMLDWFAARLYASYVRYQYAADPPEGAVYEASGAYDHYFHAAIGPAVSF